MRKMVFVVSFIVCMVCMGCGNSGSEGKDGIEARDAQEEGQSGEVWEAQEWEVQDGTEDEDVTGTFENVQVNNVETDAYIKEYVVLEEDSEIEGCEWMQYDRRTPVLRVRIRYKEKPENAYQQKEDYFLFLTGDNEISQVLVVNYEDKGIHIRLDEGTKCEGNHELGEGCDFDAHFEDVTFDGNRDLIISVGNSRHAAYYCAYIYEEGGFRHEKTFEHIPSYEVKQDEKVICGHDTDGMEWEWKTVYEYRDGEFFCVEESKTALRP